MEMKTTTLYAALEQEYTSIMQTFAGLRTTNADTLARQPAPDKWSAIQVLAHLSSYNRYYLPELETAIKKAIAKGSKKKDTFKAGMLGDYFTKTMYSDVVKSNNITNKMKSPKDHMPAILPDMESALNEFDAQQKKLYALLQLSKQIDITKAKVPISIARFIRINAGDTFRFVIAHQVRHFLQIKNTLNAIGSNPAA